MMRGVNASAVFSAMLTAILLVGATAGRAAEPADAKALAEAIRTATGISAGLCAHLGAGDGGLTAELARGKPLLVHGLALDAASLDAARRRIDGQKLYGQASVELSSMKDLPYADNLVNLAVADDLPKLLAAGVSLKEIMRVVAPNGVAFLGDRSGKLSEADLKAALSAAGIADFKIVSRRGLFARVVKPRPAEMDEWTHRHYDAAGNMVSADRMVGASSGLRWISGPCFAVGPRKDSTLTALSANGRVFHQTNCDASNLEVAPAKGQWFVTARDAYNGLLLWKRTMAPLPYMANKKYESYRASPSPIVAMGERVYAPLRLKSLSVLNAADGQELAAIPLEANLAELSAADGQFVGLTESAVCSLDVKDAKVRWARPCPGAVDLLLSGGRAYFLDIKKGPPAATELVCLDLKDGKEVYRVGLAALKQGQSRRDKPLTLRFIRDGRLFVAWEKGVHALSAADGKPLWQVDDCYGGNPYSNVEAFHAGGLVWVYRRAPVRGGPWTYLGLEPASGKVVRSFDAGASLAGCGMSSGAGDRLYFVKEMSSVDLKAGKASTYHGTRGPCQIYALPANGLLYTNPWSCGCIMVAVTGFAASDSSAGGKVEDMKQPAGRLQLGPAADESVPAAAAGPEDWPTFRHDARRGNSASTNLPEDLEALWSVKLADPPAGPLADDWKTGQLLGDPLSAVTVAAGMVFLAVPDAHRVQALDAGTGHVRWGFIAGGRVDSPPTIHEGLCLFGARDGWVYCLRAADGALRWRFRAAPREKRIMAFGQLESSWPVSGAVLVQDGVVSYVAGRSSAVDHGFWAGSLEARSGKLLWERQSGGTGNIRGRAPSALVGDGAGVYVHHARLNIRDGQFAAGSGLFLNPATHGLLGSQWRKLPGSTRMGQHIWEYGLVRGTMLTFDERQVFAHEITGSDRDAKPGQENPYVSHLGWIRPIMTDLYAVSTEAAARPPVRGQDRKPTRDWSNRTWAPAMVEAVMIAGQVLYTAGTTDYVTRKEGFIRALSRADGELLKEIKLDSPPVYDGLAAAGGRLYIATLDGRVLCLGAK